MPVKIKTKAILSGLLAMSMVACVNAKPLTIGMSFQELNNEYFVTMKESLEQSAKILTPPSIQRMRRMMSPSRLATLRICCKRK